MNTLEVAAVVGAVVGLNHDTYRHSIRVQRLAVLLGEALGLSERKLSQLSLGALLHDVGKRRVPVEILQKPSSLNEDEWEIIELHPVFGWEYAHEVELDQRVQEIILDHHYWYNGQGGYPAEANGRQRPGYLTQITTVADVLDAMTQERPYRKALSVEEGLGFLQDKSGTQFSPDVVQCVTDNLASIRAVLNI